MSHSSNVRRASGGQAGFSLVELMVAMLLGLVLTAVMINVYLYSKNSVRRQEQLNTLQQNVRVAFEYLASDARMIGHLGCYTGKTTDFTTGMASGTLKTNLAIGVEGYDFTLSTANALTLASNQPADDTTASHWATNGAPNSIAMNPGLISSGDTSGGLTPGSDVLVIRTVAGNPRRLSAATVLNGSTIAIENVSGGKCSNGTTDKVSGFCQGSYGLIASCGRAHVFQVNSIAGSTLTIGGNLGAGALFQTTTTEVFPFQTVVYYVKRASTGDSMSLYRRIFDGDNTNGLEQELVDGVESMQIRYGVDRLVVADTADGAVNGYVTAASVLDWGDVVAVRMSLLMRAASPVEGDSAAALPASGVVNGVTVTYPANSKFDRRVFTTTVAVRNKISYGL